MIVDQIMPAALANHLWQSTLFALAAALLAFALRKNRAETRYWLWLAASLKFLIPFSILVAIGGTVHWPATAPVVHSTFGTAVQEIGQPFAASPAFPSPARVAASSGPASTIPVIAFAIWLCGFAVVLLAWARSWLRIRAVMRCSQPVDMDAPIRILSSESSLEPGVFGIFRPVLLLPAGIAHHLEPAHLRAIVAHELCHVRRRDNMAAAVHMLVEAIFWFHPLVWWVGTRMVEERERACDEEVLRLGNQPHVYAESILKTCQFFVESPSVCMSGVTSADLKKRIMHIMSQGFAARLTLRKKLLLASTATAALALPLAVGLLSAAQSTTEAPAKASGRPLAFEVASIKPSGPGTRGPMFLMSPGGRVRMSGMDPKFLIQMAYDVKDSQIEGGPWWINSEHYDIEAKPEDSVAATFDRLPPEQRKQKLQEMMQSLVRDRFKLALGHDTKELPVYILVPAKNGPKLKRTDPKHIEHPRGGPPLSSDAGHNPPSSPQPGGEQPAEGEGLMMHGPGHLESAGAEMSMLVGALTTLTHKLVIDKTGLTGNYDFTLNWTPDGNQLRLGGPGGPEGPGGPGAPPPGESNGPDLFTALQQQLGLKLEPKKAPVDVLVIQHVEKPSEN